MSNSATQIYADSVQFLQSKIPVTIDYLQIFIVLKVSSNLKVVNCVMFSK